MTVSRRKVLTGLASLGAAAATPAWAQVIGPQSDPWAQVDPYADPRNGFPSARPAPSQGRRQLSPTSSNDMVSHRPADAVMSEQDEIALGRAGYPLRIAKGGGAYSDPAMQNALKAFCHPLLQVADRKALPWQVCLVNDRSPNASAGMGGTIVVHAGLLSICDRAGELAAVIAHEIGHVDKYHLAQAEGYESFIAQLRQMGVGKEYDAYLENLVPNSQGEIGDTLSIFSLSFSREQEAEADAHEMVILERLGVDPIHAINDQLNFAKLSDIVGGEINELAMSHPRNASRLEHIRSLAAMQKRPAQDYVFPGWDQLKAKFPTFSEFKKA